MGKEDSNITTIIHDFDHKQNKEATLPRKNEKQNSSNHLHPGVDNSRQRRKSPVTVQEWVAALPIPHTVQRGLALETQQLKERKNKKTIRTSEDEDDEDYEEDDDEINEILKGTNCNDFIPSKQQLNSRNSSINVGRPYNDASENEDDNLVLGAEAASSGHHNFYPSNKEEVSQKRKCRNSLDSRRRYLKESRELYRSFQSDISIKTVSSVDSVLLARELNPTEMLMELGFGGPSVSNLARIPRRFLKDSEVKGISLRKFLSLQEEVFEYGGGMDNISHTSMDDPCSYNIKSKSEIVDSFLEHLINPSYLGQSWAISSWPSSGSLSRIPSSYTTNSIISTSQSSSCSHVKLPSLKGVQAFRAAAQSVLSPANRQFLTEKPKPARAKKLILGDETLTVNEDGDIKNTSSSEKVITRSLSVGSAESDWSGDDEELRELKRVAESSAEKNKAIQRWKRIRKAAVQKKKESLMSKEKSDNDARLIFPLEKPEEDSSSASIESEDENDEARSLPYFGERTSFQHHFHIQSPQTHRNPLKHRLSTSSDPQVINYLLNTIQRDHRIPKRFSFNSTPLSKYCA